VAVRSSWRGSVGRHEAQSRQSRAQSRAQSTEHKARLEGRTRTGTACVTDLFSRRIQIREFAVKESAKVLRGTSRRYPKSTRLPRAYVGNPIVGYRVSYTLRLSLAPELSVQLPSDIRRSSALRDRRVSSYFISEVSVWHSNGSYGVSLVLRVRTYIRTRL
jgi:hypothetical protein